MPLTSRVLTEQSLATGAVGPIVEDTFDLLNATLMLQETGGELTATGAEQTIYIANDPLGTFRPVCLFVDLDAMQGGDTCVFRVYYRIVDGGALQLHDYGSYVGADGGLANSRKLITIDLYPTRFGVRVTLEQTAGQYVAYPWEVFVEN